MQMPLSTELKFSDYSDLDPKMWESMIEPAIQDALVNYLVHGFNPGSFTFALLANDMHRAIGSMHPKLSYGLKHIVMWVLEVMPRNSYGDYETVTNWIQDVDSKRSQFTEWVSKRATLRMLTD